MLFTIKRETLGTQFEAERLLDELKVTGKKAGYAGRFCSLMACTQAIHFEQAELEDQEVSEIVKPLAEMWAVKDQLSITALWTIYLELDTEVTALWNQAYNQANKALLPAFKKASPLLTETEKEEAANPDSEFRPQASAVPA